MESVNGAVNTKEDFAFFLSTASTVSQFQQQTNTQIISLTDVEQSQIQGAFLNYALLYSDEIESQKCIKKMITQSMIGFQSKGEVRQSISFS